MHLDIDSPRQSCAGCGTLPSARVVSNYVCRSNKKPPKNKERTMMLMEWGQFCSHDITKTPISRGKINEHVSNKIDYVPLVCQEIVAD